MFKGDVLIVLLEEIVDNPHAFDSYVVKSAARDAIEEIKRLNDLASLLKLELDIYRGSCCEC